MTLVVQTTVAGQISVWLVQGKKIVATKRLPVAWHGSDRALAVVHEALQLNHGDVRDITKIIVVRGPGSFTAVRTGLIIANTLGSLFDIPIGGVVKTKTLSEPEVVRLAGGQTANRKIVRPWYGKAPNITRPKIPVSQARAKR